MILTFPKRKRGLREVKRRACGRPGSKLGSGDGRGQRPAVLPSPPPPHRAPGAVAPRSGREFRGLDSETGALSGSRGGRRQWKPIGFFFFLISALWHSPFLTATRTYCSEEKAGITRILFLPTPESTVSASQWHEPRAPQAAAPCGRAGRARVAPVTRARSSLIRELMLLQEYEHQPFLQDGSQSQLPRLLGGARRQN